MAALMGVILPGPSAAALDFDCRLTLQNCRDTCAEIAVRFSIDEGQFVGPQAPGDPPRRHITFVTLDGAEFWAEAILMPGGAAGFYEDAGALGSRLMIVQPDGSARLSLQPQAQVWAGVCAR